MRSSANGDSGGVVGAASRLQLEKKMPMLYARAEVQRGLHFSVRWLHGSANGTFGRQLIFLYKFTTMTITPLRTRLETIAYDDYFYTRKLGTARHS